MIDKSLSSKVLTIGCKYVPPQGGIAQVLWNYDRLIFEDFKFIENSRKSNAIINLLVCFEAIIKLFVRLLFDKQIRIVHIHTASRTSFKRATFFLNVSKLFNKKVVMHIHGGYFNSYYNKHKCFVEKNLRKCDKIITLSQDWVNFFSSIGFESESLENIIPEPQLVPCNIKDNLVHLLFLGLIIKRKGIYDLLEVLKIHKHEFQGKMMLDIGGNGEIEQLKTTITSYGLEDIVKYEGWVDSNKKIELLNLCDVFVLPSYVEGLPLSILEALSYELAIVSTNVGGIPSIVKDGINGILLIPKDLNALYEAVCKMVSDSDFRTKVSKNNSIQTQPFYPKNVAHKLLNIYNSLL